jgi:hypothetical protein
MARNVDNIFEVQRGQIEPVLGKRRQLRTINTTFDPNISMLVPCSTISSVKVARIRIHIGFMVAFMVLVDRTSNRRPWMLDHENAFNVFTFKLL